MLPTIDLLHKGLFCVSSFLNPHSFISSFTHSIHVFLGLPFLTPPTTTKFLHLEIQSPASLRSTCPNHLSLPCLTTLSTPTIPSLLLSSSLDLLSFRVTPDIHIPPIAKFVNNLQLLPRSQHKLSYSIHYLHPTPRTVSALDAPHLRYLR